MTKLSRVFVVLFALVAPAALPAQADARSHIRDLFHFGSCDTLICLSTSTGVHGSHYNPDASAVAQVFVDFLSRAITNSVASVPLGATSSGTTFTFNDAGIPIATAQSTGPIFGERAQTLGRGRLAMSLKYTQSSFTAIRGVPLDNLQLTLTHEDESPAGLGDPSFERDTIHIATTMDASISVMALTATWGIANNVDIGFAVPLARLSFSGRSIANLVNTTGTAIHFFKGTTGNPQFADTARSESNVTGIGDISLRAKFNLMQTDRGGAAFLTELRVPTGNEDNLLGTGKAWVTGSFIASLTMRQFTPHANIGYLYRSREDLSSGVLGAVGFDALIAPKFTLAADVLALGEIGESRLALPQPAVYLDGSVVRRTNIPSGRDNLVGASIGAKWVIAGFTAVGNALLPLGDGGMSPNLTWTVGLERTF
jgi:hypothetical protein